MLITPKRLREWEGVGVGNGIGDGADNAETGRR